MKRNQTSSLARLMSTLFNHSIAKVSIALLTSVFVLAPVFVFSNASLTKEALKAAELSAPNWVINPSNFQFNMSLVVRVNYSGVPTNNLNNIVGVFVGSELRGVATPTNISGNMYYFITAYSNVFSGETLKFKAYYQPDDLVYATPETTLFTHNLSTGSIASPFWINIDPNADFPPALNPIPADTTLQTLAFDPVNLNNYLVSLDNDPVIWSASAGANLTASIVNGILTVSPVSNTWTGTDTVHIMVTENTANQYSASVTAYFTVQTFYPAPVFSQIPPQSVYIGGSFSSFDLDNYLTYTGPCRAFGMAVFPFSGTTANPGWATVPPGAQSMTVVARPLFSDIQLAGAGAELAAFVNGTLVGKASPSGTAPNIYYNLTLANLASGPITFKFYHAENQYLYEKTTTQNFIPNGSVGSISNPFAIQFSPIVPTLATNGTVNVNIVDAQWQGVFPINYYVWDCAYPNTRRDTVTALYTVAVNYSPEITSAAAVNFQENTCFELYDTQTIDGSSSEGSGLTYALAGGDDAAKFSINAVNGKLSWLNFSPDFELPADADLNNQYLVKIRVTNTLNLSDTLALTVTVTNNATESFTPQITGGGAQCFTGSIVLQATGGASYLWSTSATTASITVTASGIYTVTVTNAFACTGTVTTSVNARPAITASGSSTPVCVNAPINLTSTPTGGSGVYSSFAWSGPNGYVATVQNPPSFAATSNAAGAYIVTVTDSQGCTSTASTTISVSGSSAPSIVASGTTPVCVGTTITLSSTPSGGSGVYPTYKWAGPNSYLSTLQNPTPFSALAASGGSYTVTVTDGQGCTAVATKVIQVNSKPNITSSSNTPVCVGSTVLITSNPSGGSAPYTAFSWTGPNNFVSTVEDPAGFTAASVAQGVYRVTVTDNNGCTNTSSTTLVVKTLPAITAGITGATCTGGTLKLNSTPTGGTTPYSTFSWVGPNSYTSNIEDPVAFQLINAAAGTYYVTVTDASGCTATSSVTASINPLPGISAANTGPICAGAQLSVSSTPSGGTAPYAAFSWSGPSGYTAGVEDPAPFTSSQNSNGTYLVTVTDAKGCTATASTTAIVNSKPVITAANNGPFCQGTTIIITSTPTSGSGTYSSFIWTGPNNFSSSIEDPTPFSAIVAASGIYKVTVTDNLGCTGTTSTTVSVSSNPLPSVTATSNSPICTAQSLSLSATPSGGSGQYSSYAWVGPNNYTASGQFPASFIANTSNAGTYSVTLTDNKGCSAVNSTTVSVSGPAVTMSRTNLSCFNSNNGTATVSHSGGAPPYTYLWSNNATTATITGLAAGTYTVTLTSSSSGACTATGSVTISQAPAVSASITQTTAGCSTSNSGTATAIGVGGSTPYSYLWPNGQTTATTTGLASGSYTVTVTESGGCTATATAVVVQETGFTLNALSNIGPICPGSAVASKALSSSTGNAGISYTWTGGATAGLANGVSTGNNPSIPAFTAALVEGTYTVTVTGTLGACSSSATYSININDAVAPVMGTCPSNIVAINTTNQCYATVNWTVPTATDNCNNVQVVRTSGPAPGTNFTVGTTQTIQYTASDYGGNLVSCTFTVTVNDTQLPTLSCPSGTLTFGTDDNFCSYTNNSTALNATGSDNCALKTGAAGLYYTASGVATGTGTTLNGNVFQVGSTTLVWTAVDQSNNSRTCAYTVVINDNDAPIISTCASDQTVSTTSNGSGDCTGKIPNLVAGVVATDNCTASNALIITQSPAANSTIGSQHGVQQLVTITVKDAYNNTNFCSRVVTLADTELPLWVNCASQMILNNDVDKCGANIFFTAPGASDNCSGTVTVTQISGPVPGVYLPIGQTQTVVFKAVDGAGNSNTCQTTIQIQDSQKPAVNCPTGIQTFGTTNNCNYLAPAALNATASDNCSVTSLKNSVNNTNSISGVLFPLGTTVVTWTATDPANNTQTCVSTIVIFDDDTPTITSCPPSRNINTSSNGIGDCTGGVPNMVPELFASDNCTATGNLTITQSQPAGSAFGAQHNDTRVVTFTVQDAAGNVKTCQNILTLKDNESPIFQTCPSTTQIYQTSPNQCSTNVNWAIPTAIDNCSSASVVQTGGPSQGFSLAVGTTYVVTYNATDAYTNSSTCQFSIKVLDSQTPLLLCPAGVQDFDASANCNYVASAALNAVASDNCGIATTNGLVNSFTNTSAITGAVFPLGSTIVNWTATDLSGNTQTCSYTVEVTDHTAPIISICPPSRNINTSSNGTGDCKVTIPNLLPELIVTDNCTILTKTQTPLAGTAFGAAHGDVQVVQFVATDNVGNSTTCEMSITVIDNELPTLTPCLANISVLTTDQYPCFSSLTWNHPTASDNCATPVFNFKITNPNNTVYGPVNIDPQNAAYSFELGNSVVQYLVTDENANSATCSFLVTVDIIKSKVGNLVWHDQNGNGIQDAGEPGLNGVSVSLIGTSQCLGTAITATTTTDANGAYAFNNVVPGVYHLVFGTPAGAYAPTGADKGSDDAKDSDRGPMGITPNFTILTADTILNIDAGFYIPAKIGNLVWDDTNGNGLQDGGEPGIAGVDVLLTGTAGDGAVVSLGTTTNATGNYTFANLAPGAYQVTFVTPTGGYVRTAANDPDGTADANDSDADLATGQSVVEILVSGEDNPTYDAGFYRPPSIGDLAWIDQNANGIQDPNEQPLPGVSVKLTGTDGQGVAVTQSKLTDFDGKYLFFNLLPGVYKLTFAPPAGSSYVLADHDKGGNDALDNDANEANGGMTINETLTSGENNTSYDAGYYAPPGLGDYVWLDDNANGVQDPGEPALDGVIMQLLDGTNTPVAVDADGNTILTKISTSAGYYEFVNLIPGNYKVKFEHPNPKYTLTNANTGTDDAQDCDADFTTHITPATFVTSSSFDAKLDAGYYVKARIGNLVWHDLNGNGLQDGGEPGLSGVQVTLTGTNGFGNTVSVNQTTNASGIYLFENVVPGNYAIHFNTPAGYVPSTLDLGGDDALDSDFGAMGNTPAFEVTSGDTILTFDAGFYKSAKIGNLVWDDTNGNGLQDGGEPGIAGVDVLLTGTAGDGAVVSLGTTTNATGNYTFANLTPGAYQVTFVTPTGGQVRTAANDPDATADANDSDADLATGKSVVEILVSGEDNPTYDAGFYRPPSIGDLAWIDQNANGIQDPNEQPLPGISVTLTGTDGQGIAVTQSKLTDFDGKYLFSNLLPGVYKLTFAPPAGSTFELTDHDLGGNDALDNDANEANGGMTINETLTSGENNTTYDAGYYAPPGLGDFVWLDDNANGVQDPGEPALSGVFMQLLDGTNAPVAIDADGNVIGTKTSNSTGYYEFVNLIPGNYKVKFENPNPKYTLTNANTGTDDAQDCDADFTTHITPATFVTSSSFDAKLDAGYYVKARIGNLVWHDLNGNGLQDAGEPGLSGVQVTLTGTNGFGNTVSVNQTTNASGIYLFENVVPGNYAIHFNTPAGYVPSTLDLGSNDALDSDFGAMGNTPAFEVTSGDTILTFDAGFYKSAKVGNLVWDDTNGNGLQDISEPGIAGVDVLLTGTAGDGAVVSLGTTTNATGNYTFANLTPGAYQVTFVTPVGGYVRTAANDPDGTADANDSDADLATGKSVVEILVSGEDNPTYDAGFYRPPSIGDYVWEDINANGAQEMNEPHLVGANVQLVGIDGQGIAVNANTSTDVNGHYEFNNLLPGVYHIIFPIPAGYDAATYLDQTGNEATDSDVNPNNGFKTIGEILVSGEHNNTYDAGFYKFTTFGNLVWQDYNGNGTQDQNEPGLANINITLTGTTGNGTTLTLSAISGPNGSFVFQNLVPGYYQVTFLKPDGYWTSPLSAVGTTGDADSDASLTSGATALTLLSSGEVDLSWDAGYYLTDYGDLPASYSTMAGPSNPAFHYISPSLYLGSCVDAEFNGGDDNAVGLPVIGTCAGGSDDENGIQFITPVVGGVSACIKVNAHNTTNTTAVLQGWIDFNGDGDVLDAGEALNLTNNGLIPAGGVTDAIYCFNVPANTAFQNGSMYSRFRLSPLGGLNSFGPAVGGEVEDYKTDIGKIGNLVWNDRNFNGNQDAGEPGIANVPVKMTWSGPDGNLSTTADNREYSTTTDISGLYHFSVVLTGNYSIRVLTPAMMTPTRVNVGINTSNDNDGEAIGSDLAEVEQLFTIGDPQNLATGENGIGDDGAVSGFSDAQNEENHDFGFAYLDYGDLPENNQSYHTTSDEIGAVHATNTQLVLGACVDAERNGMPDADAGVYDELSSNLGDGDDGINTVGINTQDCVGTPLGIVSTASFQCENKLILRTTNTHGQYVYYVVNGDFSPAINAAGGFYSILGSTVIVSSSSSNGAYTGNTPALIQCIAQKDGFAPDLVTIGGMISLNLVCFDKATTCNDDENGIRFETPLIPGYDACVRVSAKNATTNAATLQGWIDWNGDGQLDNGEALQFANGGIIPSGGLQDAQFCFPVPLSAKFNAGRVYARFRLSPNGGLSPDGPAVFGSDEMPLGEVEDYIEEVGKVGNLVWEDRNFDGLQGNPTLEPGMNNVAIQLTWAGPDGNITTVSDNRVYETMTAPVNGKDGVYYFCGLLDGTYKLTATTPTDFVQTLIHQGGNNQLDADDFVFGDVFSWPDVANLVLNEQGVSDMPGALPNFPDAHDDQTHDAGFVAVDFGDNVTVGNTLLPNGARATLVPGLYLGLGADAEPDGMPDNQAGTQNTGGDDADPSSYHVGTVAANGDDEDGFKLLTPLVPGYEACCEITTTTTAPYSPAYVSMWTDYNGNNTFDANEKVLFTTINGANVNSSAPQAPNGQTTQRYCFIVPSDASFAGGAAQIRLRLNTTPNISPTGLVIFGEVEDYWQPLSRNGNYVWTDTDIEGDQDASEIALANVPVQVRWYGEDQVFGSADDRLYNTVTDANGKYQILGLIPGAYRIYPFKYTGVANALGTMAPLNKILTIPNLAPANGNNDSDGAPFIPLQVPNLVNAFLPLNENGLADNNGQNGFPDANENLSLDFGFITNPVMASSLEISGVQKPASGICGNFDAILTFCLQNTGEVPVNMLQATLDLASQNALGSMFLGFVPGAAPQIISSTAHQNPVLNNLYNGGSVTTLFNGASGWLWPGEKVCVRFTIALKPNAAGAPVNPDLQAIVHTVAVNFQGVPIPDYYNGGQVELTDLSDDGHEPSTNNPYAPGDTGGYDDATPLTDCWKISQPLVQNDIVHVSIDSTCLAYIEAGSVLEGEADNCTEFIYPLGAYYKVVLKNEQTGVVIPNPLTAAYIGKTIVVEVEHIVSCNKVWGKILLEDKLAPALICPPNITVACSESLQPAHTGTVQILDCSTTTTQITEEVQDNGECGAPRQIMQRTFIVKDAWNNQSLCSHLITVEPFSMVEMVMPPDITVDCESAYLNPSATQPVSTGQPTINGAPIGASLCSASLGYTDVINQSCEGSYEIYRTWLVANTCLPTGPGNPVEYLQRIRVKDFGGPQFTCPADITVSVDPFTCCATAALPDVVISEGCSEIIDLKARVTGVDPSSGLITTFTLPGTLSDFPGNNHWTPDTLAVFAFTQCLPNNNTYTVRYTASDKCANTSSCEFNLTVQDLIPPVATCDQFTQVDLGGDGTIFVNASTFDDGSKDNCAPVEFKARRMLANACQADTVFYDQVKFCCSDINDTLQVVFRVYDVDVPSGEIALDAFEGHYNDCMVQVFVADKIHPICTAPANVTVSCENFDPSLGAYGKPEVNDNCCLDTSKLYQGQIGLIHTANYSQFDTLCNKGTITRNFKAVDCAGLTGACTQRVVVNYEQDYYVRFPNDAIISSCDGTGNYGAPTFFGKDCEQLAVTFEDQIFTVVPDACFEIQRTWKIINWCSYNSNQPLVAVPNPNPNTNGLNAQNLPGPIVSPLGTPAPWAPTVVKVAPTDPQATNFSTFYNANANGYQYKQIIKVIDTQNPVIANCPDTLVPMCDYTLNNNQLWNADHFYDPIIGQHDLCEGPSILSITTTDSCTGPSVSIHYLLFLDIDGDGTQETVINSLNPPVAGTVNEGNVFTPNYQGGTAHRFDHRNLPTSMLYYFAMKNTLSGGNKVASVAWNTQQAPGTYFTPELPYGRHKIEWVVSDGCGNQTICDYEFEVKDCKNPTAVCLNGLTTNIMPDGTVILWASDFLQYAEDNCSPADQIQIGVRKSNSGPGFPLDNNGQPVKSVSFSCDDLGTQTVQIWAKDKAGNADYCETYVIVQDNSGNCIIDSASAKVAGKLATEMSAGVSEGNVEIAGSGNGIPSFTFATMSDNQGFYNFNGIPKSSNSTLTPLKDDNPLNGVSTYDLVLISRHVLGIQSLDSPYKIIAADANKSYSVTTFDIVEIRKLILGIYDKLPNNTSWRFVDKDYVFPNLSNPFQEFFPENKSIAAIQSNQFAEDFVAVKIGDVNNNAAVNLAVSSEDRSAGTLLFEIEDRMLPAVGSTFTVDLKPTASVSGYQFTINHPGLEVIDITPGANMTLGNFGVFEDAITTSYDGPGAGAFSITFRALKAGKLSELLSVSSRITKAEAYPAFAKATVGEKMNVAFRFNNGATSTVSGVGFELYQNQPNPFVNKTVIGFHLPAEALAQAGNSEALAQAGNSEASAQAGNAEARSAKEGVTLTIYDETGRLIHTQKGEFAKGYNSITIDRALLNTVGVLYYQLETATNSATKKMIQTK